MHKFFIYSLHQSSKHLCLHMPVTRAECYITQWPQNARSKILIRLLLGKKIGQDKNKDNFIDLPKCLSINLLVIHQARTKMYLKGTL